MSRHQFLFLICSFGFLIPLFAQSPKNGPLAAPIAVEELAKTESYQSPGSVHNLEDGLAMLGSPFKTHAPLAYFSLGSLAIGGLFYGIQAGLNDPKVGFVRKDKATIGTAVGVAGLTALIAGASFFFYSHKEKEQSKSWNTQVSGDFDKEGKLAISASLILPLPNISL